MSIIHTLGKFTTPYRIYDLYFHLLNSAYDIGNIRNRIFRQIHDLHFSFDRTWLLNYIGKMEKTRADQGVRGRRTENNMRRDEGEEETERKVTIVCFSVQYFTQYNGTGP